MSQPLLFLFFFSSRRRHTRFKCDWSSDVCSSDLLNGFDKTQPVKMEALFPGKHLEISIYCQTCMGHSDQHLLGIDGMVLEIRLIIPVCLRSRSILLPCLRWENDV